MMYSKILVALDRSSQGRKVFELACELAQVLKAELKLLHVLSPEASENPSSFAPYTLSYDPELFAEFQQEWENFKKECLNLLEVWAREAQEKGIEAEFTQRYGNPGSVICQQAQDWGAELIVMGRRGHSTFGELFLGSVSSYVIHRCHCAVHLVQS
jgi:nucleotide-binding universal stress UspA family protein